MGRFLSYTPGSIMFVTSTVSPFPVASVAGGVAGGVAGLLLFMAVIMVSIVVVHRRDSVKKRYQIDVLMSQVRAHEKDTKEMKGMVKLNSVQLLNITTICFYILLHSCTRSITYCWPKHNRFSQSVCRDHYLQQPDTCSQHGWRRYVTYLFSIFLPHHTINGKVNLEWLTKHISFK